MWLFLSNQTHLFSARQKITVLHIAPEPCLEERIRRAALVRYVSVDANPARAGINADVTFLPFRENAVDVILCNHVLEHVADDGAALREMFRVLKEDGWAVLQVPLDRHRQVTYEDPGITSPEGRELAFGQYDHVRVYGLDYERRLSAAGLMPQFDSYPEEFSERLVRQYGLSTERIFLVKKKAT